MCNFKKKKNIGPHLKTLSCDSQKLEQGTLFYLALRCPKAVNFTRNFSKKKKKENLYLKNYDLTWIFFYSIKTF